MILVTVIFFRPDTVSLLLDRILGEEKSESAIVGGIQVLLTLLDVNKSSIPKYNSQNIYNSSSYDEASDLEHRQKVTQSTVKTIQKRLKEFHNLLLDPPKVHTNSCSLCILTKNFFIKQNKPIVTTYGILEQPLGNTRLQVARLLAAVISTNNADVMQELITLETMQVLLDLFFKYQWNNFLHTQVEMCINAALKTPQAPQETGDCNALCRHVRGFVLFYFLIYKQNVLLQILVKCKLIERILDAWIDNDQQQ